MRNEGIGTVIPTLVNRWYTDEFVASRPVAIERRIGEVNRTPTEVFLSVFDVYANNEMGSVARRDQYPQPHRGNDRSCSPATTDSVTRSYPTPS